MFACFVGGQKLCASRFGQNCRHGHGFRRGRRGWSYGNHNGVRYRHNIHSNDEQQGRVLISFNFSGKYRLETKAPGFKTAQVLQITLEVSQSASVDVRLEVGSVSQDVSVQGTTAPLLETNSGAIGQVIENKLVTDLPLNGRNFQQLLILTPGTTPTHWGDAWNWYRVRACNQRGVTVQSGILC